LVFKKINEKGQTGAQAGAIGTYLALSPSSHFCIPCKVLKWLMLFGLTKELFHFYWLMGGEHDKRKDRKKSF